MYNKNMKKEKIISIVITSFILFWVIFYYQKTFASMGLTPFGGKIYAAVAVEVEQQKAAGYICVVPGQTVTVMTTKGAMKSFFIPAGILNKTGKTIMNNKYILGLYREIGTVLSCPHSSGIAGATTVELPTISLFGTS